MWALPSSASAADAAAAQRYLDFKLGIYADPLWFGAWPASVAQRIAALPPLPSALAAQLNASRPDFFAVNTYSSLCGPGSTLPYPAYHSCCTCVSARPVRHGSMPAAPFALAPCPPRRFVRDQANATGGYGEGRTDLSESYRSAGNASLGALADSDWLYLHPAGMRQLLKYVNSRRAPSAAWSLAMPPPARSLHWAVPAAPGHGRSMCPCRPGSAGRVPGLAMRPGRACEGGRRLPAVRSAAPRQHRHAPAHRALAVPVVVARHAQAAGAEAPRRACSEHGQAHLQARAARRGCPQT